MTGRFIASLVSAAALLALLLGSARADDAPPRRLALLVGVSEYPARPDGTIAPLQGPKNDVTLMYRALTAAGIPAAHIRVLADSLDRADLPFRIAADGPPTRAEILRGFRWLTETAHAGDQVTIYLAGHGSLVPEAAKPGGPTEDNGEDQIFLPIDVGRWDEQAQRVENQILDDEFGAFVTALLQRGVAVWFIADTCHSGTLSRGGPGGDLVAREADPVRALGVPAGRRIGTVQSRSGGDGRPPRQARGGLPVTAPRPGGFVGFYAVHPEQLALEGGVPRDGSDRPLRVHGLFTWALVQALTTSPSASYEDVAQRVLAGYWEWGGRVPVPMFEGELRTPFPFGHGIGGHRLAIRNDELVIVDGLLDDVAPGDVLAVSRQAEPDAAPLFFARIRTVGLAEAVLDILTSSVEHPSRLRSAILDGLADREISAAEERAWLRRSGPGLRAVAVARPPSFVLRVASPVGMAGPQMPDPAALNVRAALQALMSRPAASQPFALDVVEGEHQADVRLLMVRGRVWFQPERAVLETDGPGQPYSLSAEEAADPDRLGAALRAIARARNLVRVAALYENSASIRKLRVDVALAPTTVSPCPRHRAGEPTELPADAVPTWDRDHAATILAIAHCTRVFLTVQNEGERDLDVTPLYVDPWSQIHFLGSYRDAAYTGLRVKPGESRIVSYTEVTAPNGRDIVPVGAGRLVVLVVEGDRSSPFVRDFRYLAGGPPLGPRRSAASQTGLDRLLETAAFGLGSVRSAPITASERAGAVSIRFETSASGSGSR